MNRMCDLTCRLAINVGSSSIKVSAFRGEQRIDVNLNFIGMMEQKLTEVKPSGQRSYPCKVVGYTDAAMLTLSRIREMLAEFAWNSPEIAAHRVKFAGIGPHVQEFDEDVCNQ